MMKFKLFVLAILFVTVSLLIVPDLTHTPVSGQADKSFKGTIAPFVPPSSSERLGSLPGNNFEFDDEEEVEGDQEEEEIDRDKLPVLTKQERDEFLSDDNIDAIEPDRLTALSQEETIDDDIDPISSIVEEIVKNETIIGDEESVPSPDSSIIKFKDQNLEQILAAQEVAPEPDNQTISTTKEGELPLNVTEDDFEIEQSDEISESESPNIDVQSFINETANEEPTAPTDNETAVTTTEKDAVEEEEEPTAPTDNETAVTTTEKDAVEEEEPTAPTDNETAVTTTEKDAVEEEEEPTAPTDNETAVTTTEKDAVEEEEEPTAPTDNETAVTTEDTVEGKPSELLEMDPETEDEIQDIKGEQQTEQDEEDSQQEEEADEAQTPQVEEQQQQTKQAQQEEEADEAQTPQVEESPNTEPIAQDGSVTTSQNQQLNIKLNANDADGDNLSFIIVDDPSNGQLGNVNPSTNTVTYTPDEDYSGEDNFTFIVNDGTSDSNEATVSITVEEQQQTKQAQQQEEDDEAQTPQEEQEEEEDSQQEEED
jgi:Big-like domain-containing protein